MRILVLGGTRFIGPHVVQRLLESGHDVTVFNRGKYQHRLPEKVRRITGDRHAISEFAGEFRKLAPSAVIDMCAYNEAEAASMMSTFRGLAGRVVVISSMDVYRGWDCFLKRDATAALESVPFTERSPLRERLYPRRDPTTDAADARTEYEKIRVERAVLNDPDLPTTILRLASIYGPAIISIGFLTLLNAWMTAGQAF